MAYTVSHNTPSVGYVSWANMNIQYEGVSYSIANGSTNRKYIWWDMSYPTVFKVTDTFPNLTNDDVLVIYNKNGTAVVVPNASVIPGDLIVPGSIAADHLSANCVTGDKILAGAVSSSEIAANSIGASHIVSNSILANHIKSGAILADHIAANQITAAHIAAEGISASLIRGDTLIMGGTVDGVIEIKDASDTTYGVINKTGIQLSAGKFKLVGEEALEPQGSYESFFEVDTNGDVKTTGSITGYDIAVDTSWVNSFELHGSVLNLDAWWGGVTGVNGSFHVKFYRIHPGDGTDVHDVWFEHSGLWTVHSSDAGRFASTEIGVQIEERVHVKEDWTYSDLHATGWGQMTLECPGYNKALSLGYLHDSDYAYIQTIHYDTSWSKNLVLQPLGGRVGIGKNPSCHLDVAGTARIDGQITSRSLKLRAYGAQPYIDFSNDNSGVYDMRIVLNSNNQMQIAGGNLGIGMNPSTPYALDVAGSIRCRALVNIPYIELRKSGFTPYIDFANDDTSDYDARLILIDSITLGIWGANLVPQFDLARNLGATTKRFHAICGLKFLTSSNKDIKEDIQDANVKNCYGLVKSLRLRTYKLKNELKEDSAKTETKTKVRYHTGVVTEEAPDALTDDEKMNINLYEYCSQMLGAIQEIQNRIEEIERMMKK